MGLFQTVSDVRSLLLFHFLVGLEVLFRLCLSDLGLVLLLLGRIVVCTVSSFLSSALIHCVLIVFSHVVTLGKHGHVTVNSLSKGHSPLNKRSFALK